MKRRLVLKLLSAVPVLAQQSGSGTGAAPPLFESVIDTAVTDDAGKPVRDLGPADFSVYEGQEARKLVAFGAVDALSGAVRAAAPMPLPAKFDRGEAHRAVMLVVDDAGISSGAAEAVRGGLGRFVHEQIGARDVAALLRSSEGSGVLEQLTADRSLLGAAVERLAFNPAARPPSTPAWPETLRYALEGLLDVRGRKAVVLFWERAPQNFDFGPLIALANRAWASLYTVYCGPLAAAPGAPSRLVKETGGLELSGDIPAALARVLRDQESYYLLGFSSQLMLGRASAVSVKLLRPGLELRSRGGLPLIAPPPALSDASSPRTELNRIIASPLGSGSLRVGVCGLFAHAAKDWLDVVLTIDGRDLAVTHELSGAEDAGFDVLLAVYGMNGEILQNNTAQRALHLTADEYRRMLVDGLNFVIGVPAGKPGVYQVRAAVLDATSSKTGVAHCTVEIPDVSKGELLVSGIALEPAVKDAGTAKGNEFDVRRVFHPGQQIAYHCSIYNASADAGKRADVEVRPRLFSGGQVIWTGDPTTLSPEAGGAQALNVVGGLKIGSDTAPGEFVLEVSVTDNGNQRTASGWTSFLLR